MRTLKFRAWDVESKHMVSWEEIEEEWLAEGYSDAIMRGDHYIPLQYTGLKDKNGVEIYEGDVLKSIRYNWKCIGHPKHKTDLVDIYEVSWSDNYCAFRCKSKHSRGYLIFNDARADKNEIEVIGNVFQNKELLNEVKP